MKRTDPAYPCMSEGPDFEANGEMRQFDGMDIRTAVAKDIAKGMVANPKIYSELNDWTKSLILVQAVMAADALLDELGYER